MRIAPHIIAPYSPKGCMDWLLAAVKVLLLLVAGFTFGYIVGAAYCPDFHLLANALGTLLKAVVALALLLAVAVCWRKVKR